ncbi:GDSL-like lipase/acylhydrolase family protein [Nocardia pseudobrasiliensis]|uniref:GDSL-like lipase/acylhydrolase family protein n=2 Tax=Nocardia pseudobrasiliensis TaxID=45979 RepID=A0A370I805_9NOCA|nr:GDSL-like lipase/acylhydrolase family protein [Nocardia pseudobrasiliensis]
MREMSLPSMVGVLLVAVGVLSAPAVADSGPGDYEEYVALGDSWAADATLSQATGDHVPLGCTQSRRNYPKQVAAALRIPVFRDASCGGAETIDMTSPQVTRLGANPAQFDRLTPTTDLVTIGIGGNDASLAATVQRCLTVDPTATPCQDALVVNGVDRMSANIDAAEPKVLATLAGIKARSPRARILLIDYFQGARPGRGCYPVIPISDSDAGWLGRKLVELDAMLADAARRAGAEFVDTYSGSVGHDACQLPGVRWVEGLIPVSANPPGPAVPFHPNQLGADYQARTILQALAG